MMTEQRLEKGNKHFTAALTLMAVACSQWGQ